MNQITFVPLDPETVHAYRKGVGDAHGLTPERQISDGGGNPCRACLKDIEAGAPMLVLAHRPFPDAQPYAETGPIFLHAETCSTFAEKNIPEMFMKRKQFLIRGYNRQNRMVYDTAVLIPTEAIVSTAVSMLARAEVAYLHLRSGTTSCFQCRIERAVDP